MPYTDFSRQAFFNQLYNECMKRLQTQTSLRAAAALFFFQLLFAAGCYRELADDPFSQDSVPQAPLHKNFWFGAIYQRYADVYTEPDANSERLTQCVFGDVVQVVQQQRGWYQVEIGSYPSLVGWISASLVLRLNANALYLKERNLQTIVIRQESSQVFIWPSNTLTIDMGTELPFIGESGDWYLVRLPTNDIGRIAKHAVVDETETVITDTKPVKTLPVKTKPVKTKPEKTKPAVAAVEPEPSFIVVSKKTPTTRTVLVPQQRQQNSIAAAEPILIPRQRREIITTAQRFLGKVYVWGGTTPRGFDCSGFSYFIYKLNGIDLPRVSWLQFRNGIGKKIEKKALKQGDLVFFQTYRRGASHVGIYIGNDLFIHASPQYGVTTSSLNDPYFKKRYIGAKTLFSAS